MARWNACAKGPWSNADALDDIGQRAGHHKQRKADRERCQDGLLLP